MYVKAKMKLSTLSMTMLLATTGYNVQAAEEAGAEQEKIEKIQCVGITGSTGAGKALHQTLNFNWRSDNISPYKTFTHQHIAEIEKSISNIYEEGKKLK